MALSSISSVRDYISRMASDVTGMKVLVMDAETTGIVSMVYTQTQILQHEVFLIDSIERGRTDKMAHLKALYFVRPTHENVRLLQQEFKEPKCARGRKTQQQPSRAAPRDAPHATRARAQRAAPAARPLAHPPAAVPGTASTTSSSRTWRATA